MAHNLFGNRFYSFRSNPWHKKGYISQEPLNAVAAYEKMGGYRVRLDDLQTVGGMAVPNKAVIREATADDPNEKCLSVVGPDYVLVSPWEIVNAWDEMVHRPVETMGALGSGATFFCTTKLPTLDVKGDEIEFYMALCSPMTGGDAISIMTTGTRVVCQNTLNVAKKNSTETHRIVHDTFALPRLKLWLEHVHDSALKRMQEQNEAFRAMAEKPIDAEARGLILEMVYTMPALPNRNAPASIVRERMEKFEYDADRAMRRRAGVLELLEGKGTALDTPATGGTTFGLYNAIAEMEDYGGNGDGPKVMESLLLGDRARTKARAFDACMEYVVRP
jgi:arsenate reductase-like glutaredoxin family protein